MDTATQLGILGLVMKHLWCTPSTPNSHNQRLVVKFRGLIFFLLLAMV